MDYMNLGLSGLKVSTIGFGIFGTFGFSVDVRGAKVLLESCRDSGVNFFDTSAAYCDGKADRIFGEAMEKLRWNRSKYVVATTLFSYVGTAGGMGHSRKGIIEGVQEAIERLRLKHLDLVYITQPDATIPVGEILGALKYVIDSGFVHYWGTHEWDLSLINETKDMAQGLGLSGPIVNKVSYNYCVRKKMQELSESEKVGVGLVTYYPLAGGILTGKYRRKGAPPKGSRYSRNPFKHVMEWTGRAVLMGTMDKIRPIAKELDCEMSQLAIAWCLKQGKMTSVLIGASDDDQYQENIQAIQLIPKLTESIMERIQAALPDLP